MMEGVHRNLNYHLSKGGAQGADLRNVVPKQQIYQGVFTQRTDTHYGGDDTD